ncbi:chemotaxis protein CheW [Rhodoferax ferrireducens]|uniref:chemotaxis protein CheW n=1 Tax=Rhodoferax ferrireducens TaxID=192843 RepID=UPI000E0D6E46|nr:chemotaxis protein CheW [Rhodoferax ferrireducens]
MPTIVIFALDQERYALPLERVERAVRIVEVTPLPKTPAIVCGIVNVRGRLVPVINLRRRFGLPERNTQLGDQLLIARSATRTLAMIVDAVSGVAECNAQAVPGSDYVQGIAKLADGMVLIHDLDSFLSLDEAQSLDQALAADSPAEAP